MNSVMQCLKRVNELKDSLTGVPAPSMAEMQAGLDPMKMFTHASGQVMKNMEVEEFAVTPRVFIQLLKQVFPIFAETDGSGHPKQ